jgi:aspartate aminotransferase-like enzyme
MKLFTVGPVDMYEDTLKLGAEPIPYFRTNEFSETMFKIEKNFLKLLGAGEGSRLITFTASGTGAMESVFLNLFDENDKLLIVNGGSFGHRFCMLAELYGVPYDSIDLEYEADLTGEILKNYDGKGYTALLVNIHETSVGKLYDYRLLGDFCKRNNMYLVVDAISSFLADELKMDEAGIDVVITSSQKAIALPPGLSFVALGRRILSERVMPRNTVCMYFDYKDSLKNMERGQTPFTPAVGIILQLEQRLDTLIKTGVEAEIGKHKKLADGFRKMCQEAEIPVPAFRKSNALTTIEFPRLNAIEVFNTLKNEHGIMLTPSGGDMANKILRVGHLGDRKLEDYEEVVRLIKAN